MKTTYHMRAAILGLAALTLAACHDAIFATIDTEKKSATNTLSETLNVVDIEATGTGAFTVAAGGIFQGALSGANGTMSWNPNTNNTARPFNPAGLLCNVMTLFNNGTTTNLYGGFTDQQGGLSVAVLQRTPQPMGGGPHAAQIAGRFFRKLADANYVVHSGSKKASGTTLPASVQMFR